MKNLKKFEDAVSEWPSISVHPHRFAAKEFRLEMQRSDISFSRSVRDALLAEALAEEHHWAPDSGWISFHMRKERDITHALWLMRLSYLRYALKINSDSRALLEHESEELHLAPRFRSLLEKFVPSSENASSSFPRIERDAADGRPY